MERAGVTLTHTNQIFAELAGYWSTPEGVRLLAQAPRACADIRCPWAGALVPDRRDEVGIVTNGLRRVVQECTSQNCVLKLLSARVWESTIA